jgi:hypothetical protein
LHCGPAHRRERLVEQAGVIARIEHGLDLEHLHRTRIRHVLLRDEVPPPNLDAVDAHLVRDRVEQPLADERRLIAPRRTIGCGGCLVGQAKVAAHAVRWHAVRTRQHARGQVGHTRAVRAHVGALVVEELVVDRQDAATGVDRRAHAMTLLARVVARHQVLPAILDPLYGAAETQRSHAGQKILRIQLAAHPEAPADVALVQLHGRRVALEHARDHVAVRVGPLGRAMQLQQVARRVVPRDRGARLERHPGMPADGKLELDDRVGAQKGAVDITVLLPYDRRLDVRCLGVEHRGERVDVQFHPFGRVLGAVCVLGEYRRDRLADIAHQVVGEHRLPIRLESLDARGPEFDRRDFSDVGGGPHRHAAGRARSCRVDAKQPSMGVGRTHDPHVQLAWKGHGAREAAMAGEKRQVLETRHRAADELAFHRISSAAARTALTMFW